MIRFIDIIPNPEDFLALAPEELAGVVLQHLNSIAQKKQGKLNCHNFSLGHNIQEYPSEYHEHLQRALMEAWVWLESEGFLAPEPGAQGDWVFITRKGKNIATPKDLEAYRRANLLPKQLLNGRIAQKVWATFLRGDYDTAVFQAFREVEVLVRSASGYEDADLGVSLVRKAFEPGKGPLTDKDSVVAEQEALAHLFAGAIGSYKNPTSHISIAIEAVEAVEMLILASQLLNQLLNIVEKRLVRKRA